MSELVKKSTADCIMPSARELSSAFLAGLMKMSIGGRSAVATAADSAPATFGLIHSLSVKLSVMALLCSLVRLLKTLTFSSMGLFASNLVILGTVFVVVVEVMFVVVVVVVAANVKYSTKKHSHDIYNRYKIQDTNF